MRLFSQFSPEEEIKSHEKENVKECNENTFLRQNLKILLLHIEDEKKFWSYKSNQGTERTHFVHLGRFSSPSRSSEREDRGDKCAIAYKSLRKIEGKIQNIYFFWDAETRKLLDLEDETENLLVLPGRREKKGGSKDGKRQKRHS